VKIASPRGSSEVRRGVAGVSSSSSRTLALPAGAVLERPGAFVFLGVATSVKTIITIPRSASGSSIARTVISTLCVSPLVATLSPLAVIVPFCRIAFWKALPRSKRSPSRAMAKIFQLVLPAAGSRYLARPPADIDDITLIV